MNPKEGWTETPWGALRVLIEDDTVTVKELWVKEGHRCSLQYHNRRCENFTWKSGTGWITHAYPPTGEPSKWSLWDNKRLGYDAAGALYPEDLYDFVSTREVHRIEGGPGGLGLIEVWVHIDTEKSTEEDIVRIEDDYNRA